MLVILDGVKERSGYGLDNIQPNDVETIEVLKYASTAMYGVEGGNGVILITSRQGGSSASDIKSVGILPITVAGFYKAREFYTPKYDHPNDDLKRPDLRSTIYWQPELITDKNGEAALDFYNADGTGTYRVVIEGIDENGNLGRTMYKYKVN
jgi:TonB-dependent SusC/RagA subfamily outer membrane receptor